MAAIFTVRNADGDMEEVQLPSLGWTLEESAEEGNASQTQIAIPDPDLSIDPDHLIGWRRAILYEDESEADNDVLWSGFVSVQDIGRTGGEYVEPLGRVWNLSMVDMNTLWDQRLLRGTDTKRAAETDVARMTWLVATEEMGYFDDTSLISSSDPESLDKRDTARTTCKQVADECSQQSGKNYWMGATRDGIFVWYGNDSLTTYSSDLSLSNDPADWDEDALADGSSLVWPLSFDTTLSRDPNRVYDGAMIEYEGGAVYRKNAATSAFFTLSGRDIDVPAPEIKTKAKAQRRGDRMLADLDTQNEVVTTTVEVPASKATMIRAGMRILVRATHLPGWEDFGWARILTCAITPAGFGGKYRLTLKLQGPTSEGTPVTSATLAMCNTVLEDASRDGAIEATGVTFTAGQVWRYTITNTTHDPVSITDKLALSYAGTSPTTGPTIVRAWGVSAYWAVSGYPAGTPTPAPSQGTFGFGGTHPAFASDSGTFTVGITGVGKFTFYAGANYEAAPVGTDECWSCLLERLS